MPDQPYTDADLRAEAARQLATAGEDPDFMGVGEQMQDSLMNGDGVMWNDGVLTEDQFDAAQRKIHDLINGAADTSEWAVNLGADGLEPVRHRVHINSHGEPRVRLHFAFAPDMDEDTRRAVIERVGDVIRDFS